MHFEPRGLLDGIYRLVETGDGQPLQPLGPSGAVNGLVKLVDQEQFPQTSGNFTPSKGLLRIPPPAPNDMGDNPDGSDGGLKSRHLFTLGPKSQGPQVD